MFGKKGEFAKRDYMGACHIIKEKDEQLSYGRGRHTSGLQEEWETES